VTPAGPRWPRSTRPIHDRSARRRPPISGTITIQSTPWAVDAKAWIRGSSPRKTTSTRFLRVRHQVIIARKFPPDSPDGERKGPGASKMRHPTGARRREPRGGEGRHSTIFSASVSRHPPRASRPAPADKSGISADRGSCNPRAGHSRCRCPGWAGMYSGRPNCPRGS